MREKILRTAGVLVLVATSFMTGRMHGTASAASDPIARCAIWVPQEWGEFAGGTSSGVAFRDSNDTLRFINQFPCGQDGAPLVALEIRRR